jgi:hypothetical protein
MANFSGYPMKVQFPRFIGQVEWDDPIRLPIGVAAVCRNFTFLEDSARTRDGLLRALLTTNNKAVSGLGLLQFDGSDASDVPARYQLVYDQGGNLKYEFPEGSGTLLALNTSALAPNLHAQICLAYDNAYIAQSDLIEGKAKPIVVSGKRKDAWPMSDLPLGESWAANTSFLVGDIISPTVSNGRIYRCEVGGITAGAEPAWPGDNGTVADGAVTWREFTPFFDVAYPTPATPAIARSGGAGAFAAGRDVYIKIAINNGNGSTDIATQISAKLANTVLNDGVIVTHPSLASWDAGLGAPYKAVSWDVYEADVATGGAEPADSAYLKANGAPIALGANYTVTTAGAGVVGPTGNTAWLAPEGNVCAGKRWMAVLFENLNGYIDGITSEIPVVANPADDGRQFYCAKIPPGRANTKRRILAFTAAGSSKAGPYFYIPEDDDLYEGDTPTGASIHVTKTTIEDNIATTAILNVPDFYLTDLGTEVTEFFKKAQIPSCSDIYFSKALNRLVLTGVPGFPTGHWISDAADPETFRLPEAELEVSENDGFRTVCYREVDKVQYSLKENGGYVVNQTDANPWKWDVERAWQGSGPCGPRAVDCTDKFMVYAHETGLYMMANQPPDLISPEITKTWARLNKLYKQLVQVKIDQDGKQIHILMPVDGSTKNNLHIRLKVRDWSQLTAESCALTRTGKVIANGFGRKWSIEPMNVSLIDISEKRRLAVSVDQRIDQRQVLFASSLDEGLVRMEVPGKYYDEDVDGEKHFIDWYWKGTPAENPERAVLGIGGVTVSAKGKGRIDVSAIGVSQSREKKEETYVASTNRMFELDSSGAETIWDGTIKACYGEDLAVAFSPHKDEGDDEPVQGTFIELHYATMYLKKQWDTRKA